MSGLIAQVVDWGALGQTVLAAFAGGVGVAFTFSITILGASRFGEGSRELGLLGTLGFGAMAIFGVLATTAAIVFGIVVMTSS